MLFLLKQKLLAIVGHSMGGRIAMEFCSKYKNFVDVLIIEDMDTRSRKRCEKKGTLKKFSAVSKNREEAIAFVEEHGYDRGYDVIFL